MRGYFHVSILPLAVASVRDRSYDNIDCKAVQTHLFRGQKLGSSLSAQLLMVLMLCGTDTWRNYCTTSFALLLQPSCPMDFTVLKRADLGPAASSTHFLLVCLLSRMLSTINL
jgi:hypothetical protein